MDAKKEEMIKHEADFKNVGRQCGDLTCKICRLSKEEQDYEWRRHQLEQLIEVQNDWKRCDCECYRRYIQKNTKIKIWMN